jgi:hypothetical protein
MVQIILELALLGHYVYLFFGKINPHSSVRNSENNRRLRLIIVGLNTKFEQDMRLRGHKFYIVSGDSATSEEREAERKAYDAVMNTPNDSFSAFLPKPKKLTQVEGLAWVKRILEQTRGLELPGTVQYTLVSHIFWEQIGPWKELALDLINKVARICKQFARTVIESSAPLEVQDRIYELGVDAAMEKSLKAAKVELDKILRRLRRHPSTYNHYVTDNIQKARTRDFQDKLAAATEKSKTTQMAGRETKTTYDPAKLANALEEQNKTNMEDYAASEALLLYGAIYKVRLTPNILFVHS